MRLNGHGITKVLFLLLANLLSHLFAPKTSFFFQQLTCPCILEHSNLLTMSIYLPNQPNLKRKIKGSFSHLLTDLGYLSLESLSGAQMTTSLGDLQETPEPLD